jgi:DDE superfamily endonuclease
VDLWWSGKHRHHGGNIQVVSTPDGLPLWTSGVRPGREHDMRAARVDWASDSALALTDLRYEGEPETFTIPVKKPADGRLDIDEQAYNALHGALRCLGERANSLLKTTNKGPAPLLRLPLAPRRHHRRRTRPAPPRTPPNHMTKQKLITQNHQRLSGKAQCFKRTHRTPTAAPKESAGLGIPRRKRPTSPTQPSRRKSISAGTSRTGLGLLLTYLRCW